MKFILNEKFILAEPTLKILEERFILNEDGDDLEDTLLGTNTKPAQETSENLLKTAIKLSKELNTTFSNSIELVKKFKSEIDKKPNKENDDTQKVIKNVLDAKFDVSVSDDLLEMKVDLEQYINALNKVKSAADSSTKNFQEFTKKIEYLVDLSKSSKWEEKEIDTLKQIVAWIDTNIQSLFEATDGAHGLKKCDGCIELLTTLLKDITSINVNKLLPEDLTQYNTFITQVIAGVTIKDPAEKSDELLVTIQQYIEILNTLESNCTKIKDSKVLTELKEKEKAINNKDEEKMDATKVDWAALYAECGKVTNKQEAYEAFWKGGLPLAGESNPKDLPIAANEKIKRGYFAGEWGKHASLIMSFGTPFMDSLFAEGWSAILNPVVALLKYLLKLPTITIDEASFNKILVALKDGYVSKKDLTGEGKLGSINLVRNPKLYSKGSEINDYLRWQKAALNKADSLPEGSSIKTVFANLVLPIEIENKNQLYTNTTALKTCSEDPSYSIRPLTEFKELIKSYLEVEAEEKATAATDADLDKILKAINRNAEKAQKFISYWVSLYRVKNPSLVIEFDKKFNNKLVSIRNKNHTTFEEDSAFDKLVTLKTIKYTKNQWESLLEKILELAA